MPQWPFTITVYILVHLGRLSSLDISGSLTGWSGIATWNRAENSIINN